MIKISEVFSGIQGEGRYAGTPMTFIRVSGCTKACLFCDTKYHKLGKEYSIEEILKDIEKSGTRIICFTGGEPLLYMTDIAWIIRHCKDSNSSFLNNRIFHVETNGDLLVKDTFDWFDYLAISPKAKETADACQSLIRGWDKQHSCDIKVVTDLRINADLIPYATILMPLTTPNQKLNKLTRQKVWKYCLENNLRYSPRLHYEIFGKRRGI